MKIFFISLLCCFAFLSSLAQEDIKDTILFLNGEKLISSRYMVNVEDGMFSYFNKRDKKKQVGLEYVFSIIDSKGNEKVYFEPTTIGKTYFTVEQMRSFVKGELVARKGYKSTFAFASGVITGAGAIYAVPSLLGLNVFFAPLVPAANATIVGSFNYNESKVIKKYPQHADDTYFIAGYQEIATQKRINNSIKGGLIGIGLGIISTVIVHQVSK
jgi:hypothetical protein